MLDYNSLKPTDLSKLVDSRIGNPDADFTDVMFDVQDWSTSDFWERPLVTSGGILTQTTSATGGIRSLSFLTTGKKYLIRAIGTSTGTVAIRTYDTATIYVDLGAGGSFDESVVITAVDDTFFIRNLGVGTTSFTTLTIQEWSGEELIPDADVGFVANIATKWTPAGANTVEQDGNAVKITYVDNPGGANIGFDVADATRFGTFVAGDKIKVVLRAKVTAGSSGTIGYNLGAGFVGGDTVTNTDWQIFYIKGTVTDPDVTFWIRLGLTADDIGWMEIISMMKVTGLVYATNMIPSPDGVLTDISGEGNEGTIYGAVSSKDGMVFDIIDDYIQLASDIVLAVSGWTLAVRLSGQGTAGTTRAILGQDFSNSLRRIVFTGADELYIETDTGSDDSVSSDNSYNENTPVDYVITVNAGVVRAWQDGVELTMSDDLVDDLTINRIGRTVTVSSPGFSFIDMQIYNVAKDAQWAIDYHNQFARRVVKRLALEDSGVGSTIG